ncbi:hypothetical protein Lepto7375DRAFT_0870 [Leptolyngbya sp. PCC 7375]|nr:hypothetical protein Lepto7375DRAFT_0870 [Leptolyngbya sp. PCC 7375]
MTSFLHTDDVIPDLDWDYIQVYEIEIARDQTSA